MTTVAHKYRHLSGFSLVELMVSITIGLIILAAVSTLFVSSKKTYSTQDRLSRLQENARFAMYYLARDIRMAGYFGCLDESTAVSSTLNTGTYIYGPATSMIAIEGLENASGNWYPSNVTSVPASIKAGTDAVTIRMSADPASTPITLTKPMPPTSAVFDVSSTTYINDGDIIMVGDCASADILQVTQTPSGLKIQHNTGDSDPPPGNANKPLSKQYTSAQVFKFIARLYYVRDNAGIPTLYMQENSGDALPLVEGVEDLQVLYGKDTETTPDGVPNVYLKAGEAGLISTSDWSRVKSVRIGMLVRTLNDKNTDVDVRSTYDVNGTTFTVPTDAGGNRDKFQRRVFVSTHQLRNLQ